MTFSANSIIHQRSAATLRERGTRLLEQTQSAAHGET
jgi:hypothetical protein